MKKFFAIAVMAVAALSANAQQEAGTWSITPKAGINISKMNGSVELTSESGETGVSDLTANKVGFVGGADVTYQISDPFALSLGVMYSQMGAAVKHNTSSKLKMDYLAVPVLANYYICEGLAIKAGVEFDFRVNCKCTEDGNDVKAFSTFFKDNTKTFQLMIPVGASYEYANFILDARYNFGVTKINKDKFTGDSFRNSAIQITLGYKIGL